MVKRNVIANYLGQGWTTLMGVAFVPIYIKYLGIEAYGLIGLFILLQAWLQLLDMGMKPTLSREMARLSSGRHTAKSIRDLLRSVELLAFAVAVLVILTVTVSADWLAGSWLQASRLPQAVVAQALIIMGIVVSFRFVEEIYRSCLIGLERQVVFNAIASVAATVRGLGAVVILAHISSTIHVFFVWQGIVSLVTVVVLAVTTYTSLPGTARSGRFSLKALSRVGRFAGGMMGITFLALLLTQVDKLLLSKLLSLSEYGYYTLAVIVASVVYRLISPITQAWFPRLSQLYAASDYTALTRVYHQGAQLITVVAGSASVILIVYSDMFLQLWTQDPNLAQRTALLLSLLALGNLLNGLMWIPYQTQLAYGWTALTLRINLVAVLALVPAILWVTPRYGAQGAACVWVLLNVGYLSVGVHLMYRQILCSEKWQWYLRDILRPLAGALIASVAIRWIVATPSGVFEQLGTLLLASIATVAAASLSADTVRGHSYDAIKRVLMYGRLRRISVDE